MEQYKLKPKDYKDPINLLTSVGVIKNNIAFPERVFVGAETAKKMRKELVKSFKKVYPSITKRALDSAVALHWLNYGPNESLDKGIKLGYAIFERLNENERQ